jgi:hypothetical protein
MTARQDYPPAGWTSFTTWTGRTFRPAAPASASRRVKAARGQAAGTAARREGVSARRRSLRSVRGLPSLLIYRHALPVRQRGEMTFITATTMPLLIALAVIGLSDAVMIPANAAALVGGVCCRCSSTRRSRPGWPGEGVRPLGHRPRSWPSQLGRPGMGLVTAARVAGETDRPGKSGTIDDHDDAQAESRQ